MECFYCKNSIISEPHIAEFKVNGTDEKIQRFFCSSYCNGKWEVGTGV